MNTIIQTPTNNLSESINFYKKLNFQILSENDSTIVSDGAAVIQINPDRFARAGVVLFKDSWKVTVEQIEKITKVHKIEDGYVLSDPSNVWIYLMEKESGIKKPEGIPPSSFGNFAGLSLETTDIHRSIELWEHLGFQKTMGGLEQGWIVFGNEDGMGVSFMQPNTCPHLFFNPSLTYFNGKNNIEVIENIRSIGIPIAEEITHFNKEGIVDNLIIRDPGGFGFFIFSD